jgi:hypothetical protein
MCIRRGRGERKDGFVFLQNRGRTVIYSVKGGGSSDLGKGGEGVFLSKLKLVTYEKGGMTFPNVRRGPLLTHRKTGHFVLY